MIIHHTEYTSDKFIFSSYPANATLKQNYAPSHVSRIRDYASSLFDKQDRKLIILKYNGEVNNHLHRISERFVKCWFTAI